MNIIIIIIDIIVVAVIIIYITTERIIITGIFINDVFIIAIIRDIGIGKASISTGIIS